MRPSPAGPPLLLPLSEPLPLPLLCTLNRKAPTLSPAQYVYLSELDMRRTSSGPPDPTFASASVGNPQETGAFLDRLGSRGRVRGSVWNGVQQLLAPCGCHPDRYRQQLWAALKTPVLCWLQPCPPSRLSPHSSAYPSNLCRAHASCTPLVCFAAGTASWWLLPTGLACPRELSSPGLAWLHSEPGALLPATAPALEPQAFVGLPLPV